MSHFEVVFVWLR